MTLDEAKVDLADKAKVLAYHLERYLEAPVGECDQRIGSLKWALVNYRMAQDLVRSGGDE